MEAKRVSDSQVEQVNIVMPEHSNSQGRLFGGQLLAWIDVVASIVSRRHSGCFTSTVHISDLTFKAPAYVGNVVILVGRITYVGSSSMEVRVDTFVEHISGQRHQINEAYFVMVAMDEDEDPVPAPGLLIETSEEKANWEAGEQRYQHRKQARQH